MFKKVFLSFLAAVLFFGGAGSLIASASKRYSNDAENKAQMDAKAKNAGKMGMAKGKKMKASRADNVSKIFTLTAVASSTLTVQDVNGKIYAANISGATKIVNKFGGRIMVSDLKAGDSLHIKGVVLADGASIKAKYLRDMSILRKKAGLEGTVKDVNHLDGTFILVAKGHGEIKVIMPQNVKVRIKGIETAGHKDLADGQKVNIKGMLDLSLKTMEAERIVIKP